MSRTKHYGKRGKPTRGEATKNRAPGYEYWSPRGAPHGALGSGPEAKRVTHRKERRDGRRAIRRDVEA